MTGPPEAVERRFRLASQAVLLTEGLWFRIPPEEVGVSPVALKKCAVRADPPSGDCVDLMRIHDYLVQFDEEHSSIFFKSSAQEDYNFV